MLLVLILAMTAAWAAYEVRCPTGPKTAEIVDIKPGTSLWGIASELRARGVVRSRYLFFLWAKARGGTLKAGTYRFAGPAPMAEVYEKLRRGEIYAVVLTVPEGDNIFDIAQAVERAGLGNSKEFLVAERSDTDLVRDLDPGAQSLEGYLFPAVYLVPPTATPRAILEEMTGRFRKEAERLGLKGDVHAVVTLASLVERETPVEADRALVAGVFVNRMARKMPLDTDPTVIYAAMLEGRYRGTIYASDLRADSAYNTYTHVGPPPGAICNPGEQSLLAAMHPAKTQYLYFVSDPEHPGHSLFATSLQEHQKNVRAYRKEGHRGNGQ